MIYISYERLVLNLEHTEDKTIKKVQQLVILETKFIGKQNWPSKMYATHLLLENIQCIVNRQFDAFYRKLYSYLMRFIPHVYIDVSHIF